MGQVPSKSVVSVVSELSDSKLSSSSLVGFCCEFESGGNKLSSLKCVLRLLEFFEVVLVDGEYIVFFAILLYSCLDFLYDFRLSVESMSSPVELCLCISRNLFASSLVPKDW